MQMTRFYVDESEEDLRVMVGQFAEVCTRKGLKVSAGKSKVMVLNGEEGLDCKAHVYGIRLGGWKASRMQGLRSCAE